MVAGSGLWVARYLFVVDVLWGFFFSVVAVVVYSGLRILVLCFFFLTSRGGWWQWMWMTEKREMVAVGVGEKRKR